jgi:hypothetical protein
VTLKAKMDSATGLVWTFIFESPKHIPKNLLGLEGERWGTKSFPLESLTSSVNQAGTKGLKFVFHRFDYGLHPVANIRRCSFGIVFAG